MYKSIVNENYLCHYNQNHSKKNGQFVSGDGDGDGIANDHARRSEKSGKGKALPTRAQARRSRNTGIALTASAAALGALGRFESYIGDVSDNLVASGIGLVGQVASIPLLAIGATKTVKGAVNMGRASRRGDKS